MVCGLGIRGVRVRAEGCGWHIELLYNISCFTHSVAPQVAGGLVNYARTCGHPSEAGGGAAKKARLSGPNINFPSASSVLSTAAGAWKWIQGSKIL